MTMKLLVATRNRHKLEEIRAIFTAPGLLLEGVDGIEGLPEVEEDGLTFEDNAKKKAVTLARAAKRWALADDSGLEVDALGGEPGVYSARYAGEPVDYEANNKKLLKNMAGLLNRKARFRCVIALSDADGRAEVVEGVCEGKITESSRGDNGFGYDPVFIPDGYSMTFAEMPAEMKNGISHRALALHAAWKKWGELLARYHC